MSPSGGRLHDNSFVDLAMCIVRDLEQLKPNAPRELYADLEYNARELLDRLVAQDKRKPPLERIAAVLERWDAHGVPSPNQRLRGR